jgi:ADP-ribosyl-[dinitrogen reductase] hydrolase
MEDKIYGLVYGQFIGDALGTRYEFLTSSDASRRVNQDLEENFLHIKGGGPFNVLPGQVTDDTELAMGLFHSLAYSEKYDPDDVARRYIQWFNSSPFDIGTTTRRAFRRAPDYSTIIKNSAEFNQSSLSNGCLMRISPLAIYGLLLSNSELINCARDNCRMTNPNELTQDAVSVYCVALKAALEGQDRKSIFEIASRTSTNPIIQAILQDARVKPSPVLLPDGTRIHGDDSNNMGYCGIALQNSFYELLNGTSFYESLVNIVKRGGDTDTNGCIAGALLGAFYGKRQIPDKWIRDIHLKNPRIRDYPESDQLHLDSYIHEFVKLVSLGRPEINL